MYQNTNMRISSTTGTRSIIQLALFCTVVFPVLSYVITPNQYNYNNDFGFHSTQQKQQQYVNTQHLQQKQQGKSSTVLFVSTTPNTPKTSLSSSLSTSTSPSSLSSSVTDNENESSVAETTTTTISNVEFPPPLSTTDRIQRAATFWSTAIPIVLTYYGLMTRIKLQELLGSPYTPEEQIQQYKLLHTNGAYKLNETITNLKGFYVKTAQIVSTRKDLFPEEYTDALSGFTDNLDPMSVELAKAIVINELLNKNEKFEDVFIEFDTIPLGAASVAQVHRAVLSTKYGGPREVAVKIQRPSIESKLMGDIANLKAITKTFRGELPLDYYTVMCELEIQLQDEFDFIKEAVAMERIYNAVKFAPDGSVRDMPLVIPRPIPGLVSRRVLVQDYLHGVPLSRARDIMIKKGIDPDSPESKLFGRKLLTSLTEVFGRTILETGFFHADPHPGNIFVLDDGQIGLIDYGQVKQISGRSRETLCKVMIALDERTDDIVSDMQRVGDLALELGVTIKDSALPEAPAAIGIWLFDGSVTKLPGGYDLGELSPNSPVKEIQSFPQDLVLVGRSSILIKGISNRLNIPWSLAQKWAPMARQVLAEAYKPQQQTTASNNRSSNAISTTIRVRFRDVIRTFKQWCTGRLTRFVQKLPKPIRTKIVAYIVQYEERKSLKKELARKKKQQQQQQKQQK